MVANRINQYLHHSGHPYVALQDAQRALRIITQLEKYVSVPGFSAGGHQPGMTVLRPEFRYYTAVDEIDMLPAKADRAALIYPVITLEKPYMHTSVHEMLVGRNSSSLVEVTNIKKNHIQI